MLYGDTTMSSLIDIQTEDGELVCVICYGKIGISDQSGHREHPVQLDCQHIFGSACLHDWLQTHSKCPICRQSVQAEHGVGSLEPDSSNEGSYDSASEPESASESDDQEATGSTNSSDDYRGFASDVSQDAVIDFIRGRRSSANYRTSQRSSSGG